MMCTSIFIILDIIKGDQWNWAYLCLWSPCFHREIQVQWISVYLDDSQCHNGKIGCMLSKGHLVDMTGRSLGIPFIHLHISMWVQVYFPHPFYSIVSWWYFAIFLITVYVNFTPHISYLLLIISPWRNC